MAFREVTVVQIKEALRRWLRGEGERTIARGVGVDRKTARRYIAAASELGVDRDGGEDQLTDELIGQLVERSARTAPTATARRGGSLLGEEEQIKAWVNDGPHRRQDRDPARAQRRRRPAPDLWPASRSSAAGRAGEPTTVRVDDPPPGTELQVDFGRLGLIADGDRRRVCHGLIFTACFSRHQFVWPTFRQTHRGGDRRLRGGVGVLRRGVPCRHPRQHELDRDRSREHRAAVQRRVLRVRPGPRAFSIDAARVRTPTDKPRVERVVPYVRNNFFAGETFVDLADCRARAETWCATTAGMRIHGTTQCRPAESFATEELALCSLPRAHRFDIAGVVRAQGPP